MTASVSANTSGGQSRRSSEIVLPLAASQVEAMVGSAGGWFFDASTSFRSAVHSPVDPPGHPSREGRRRVRLTGRRLQRRGKLKAMIEAVIFDLDGVLLDSEQVWDRARREVVQQAGGTWLPGSTEAMQGMSSREWSVYLRDRLGVELSADEINNRVVARVLMLYDESLPLLPGATDAVERMAASWRLGLASSSNRPVIDLVLDLADLAPFFDVTVSSEEVPRGKPAPDVYLEAARRLGVIPSSCAVIEDSANGIRAGVSAGMRVIAIPNPEFPPSGDVLAMTNAVLPSLSGLRPDAVA